MQQDALSPTPPNPPPIIDPTRWLGAWRARVNHHPPLIRFDRPTKTLPVSVTGNACALRCAHCDGRYLQHMRPIWDARVDGATSLLISGGCDKQGRVPVGEHLAEIARLRVGRRLNWHVGFIDEEVLRAAAPLVDTVSFDIVGDRATAQEVYGLDLDLHDYLRTFDMLSRHVPVVPHLTIGLRGGTISGEYEVLRALAERHVMALILIVFIPTAGTAYAHCLPPSVDRVADIMIEARLQLPWANLVLGCMRPHGSYRQSLDVLAVRAGLNGIVNPAAAATQEACRRGLQIVWGDECCALT